MLPSAVTCPAELSKEVSRLADKKLVCHDAVDFGKGSASHNRCQLFLGHL